MFIWIIITLPDPVLNLTLVSSKPGRGEKLKFSIKRGSLFNELIAVTYYLLFPNMMSQFRGWIPPVHFSADTDAYCSFHQSEKCQTFGFIVISGLPNNEIPVS